MTYEEFKDKINGVEGYWSGDSIEVSWCIGGMTGGSCWGGAVDTPVRAEPPCELDALTNILMEVAPGMSFLQYKKIEQLIETGTRGGGGDYYGNYTDYAYKRLDIRKLYEALDSMGVLD